MQELTVSCEEKRLSERFTTHLPITLKTGPARQTVCGKLVDFSRTGLGLLLENIMLPTEEASIQIELPFEHGTLQTRAKIVWHANTFERDMIRHGARLEMLDQSFHQRLHDFVNHHPDSGNSVPQKSAPFPKFDKSLSHQEKAVKLAAWLEEKTGVDLTHMTQYTFPAELAKRNIENFVGVSQIPVGIAGPVKINGKYANGEYYVPFATTEGTLVETYNYGMKVINRSGGVNVVLQSSVMDITPVFILQDMHAALQLKKWIAGNFAHIKQQAEQTTRHGKLISLDPMVIGRRVLLNFSFSTGDAMGLNIANIAANFACQYIQKYFPGSRFFLRSNYSADKKPASANLNKCYGKELLAEIIIPRKNIKRYFGTTPENMLDFYHSIVLGSTQAGMLGQNGHFANALAAIFIACGQDVAQVVNGSIGIAHLELINEGDLYISTKTPNIIIGTVGGGTHLPTQKACLEIMDCYGKDKVNKFSEIIAATLIAGELSICAALASGIFINAHAAKRKL